MRPKRAILVLGLLLVSKGILQLLTFSTIFTIFTASNILPTRLEALLPTLTADDLLQATAYPVVGVFLLLGGVGIIRHRGWGWLLAMIGQGIDLMLGLVYYARGEPQYVQMLVDVLLVLYLNQRDVYLALANARRRDGALQVGTEESIAPLNVEQEVELAELETVDSRR